MKCILPAGCVLILLGLQANVWSSRLLDSVSPNVRSQTHAMAGASTRPRPRVPGQWRSLEEMHRHFTNAFVESGVDGSFNGMSRAIQFDPDVDKPRSRTLIYEEQPYQVGKLNLIGLLNEPIYYKSDWLGPRREQLETYESRQLTREEQQLMGQLQRGEPWILIDAPQQTETHDALLLAPLVATHSCLRCHDVDRGTVVGAFVYQLHKPFVLEITPEMLEQMTPKMRERLRLLDVDPIPERVSMASPTRRNQ